MSENLPSRRARQRRAPQTGALPAWTLTLWAQLMRAPAAGGALVIAGALIGLAPWAQRTALLSGTWWSAPTSHPSWLRLALVAIAVSAPMLIGALWRRRAGDGVSPDLRAVASVDADAPIKGASSWLAWAGLALMLSGALLGVGLWAQVQRGVPPTLAQVSVGPTVEFVEGRVDGEPMQLMLPRRLTVKDLKMTRPAQLTLAMSRPKEDPMPDQVLGEGESVEVDGVRMTFVGIGEDPQRLRAILRGRDEASIEVAAREGDTIRVTLDGPEYTVKQITAHFAGNMGPAVQLEAEATGAFWLFGRQPTRADAIALNTHGLRLERLETLPTAALTIAPAQPLEALIAACVLFLLGVAACFVVPHVERVGPRGMSSLTEAGALAEMHRAKTPVAPAIHAPDPDVDEEALT